MNSIVFSPLGRIFGVPIMLAVAAAQYEPMGLPLDASALEVIRGGEFRTGLCLSGAAGSECNKTDTVCSQGDAFCAENGEGDLCADSIAYKNPTRCTTTETTKVCDDNGAPIICWESTDCFCTLVAGALECTADPEGANGQKLTNKCTLQ